MGRVRRTTLRAHPAVHAALRCLQVGVMLVSLKAASLGVNLISASNVVLLVGQSFSHSFYSCQQAGGLAGVLYILICAAPHCMPSLFLQSAFQLVPAVAYI